MKSLQLCQSKIHEYLKKIEVELAVYIYNIICLYLLYTH